MNNALNDDYRPLLNEPMLRSTIESVCASFGKVTFLRILPASHAPNLRCACFLQLDSTEAKVAVKSKLRALEFGDYLAFFADVDDRWSGPTI